MTTPQKHDLKVQHELKPQSRMSNDVYISWVYDVRNFEVQ